MIKSFLLVFSLFLIDQFTKTYAKEKIKNYGLSFGLLSFQNIVPIIIIVTIFFLIVLFYFYFNYLFKTIEQNNKKTTRKGNKTNKQNMEYATFAKIGFILLFSGILGNLFDRIFLGYVIDFITPSTYFPSFNLSDIFNFTGVLILIICIFKKKLKI